MALAAEEATNDEFLFIWKIENFSYCLERTGESIDSPKFTLDGCGNILYFLRLFPRGVYDALDICRLYFDEDLSALRNEISVCIADEDFLDPSKSEKTPEKIKRSWISLDKIPRSGLIGFKGYSLLPNDTLTIGFNVWYGDGMKHKLSQSVARTRIGIESSFFVWEIKGFSNLPPLQERVYFFESLPGHPQMTLKLVLEGWAHDENIRFELKQIGFITRNVMVCKIFLLNSLGYASKLIQYEHRFEVTTGEQICVFPIAINKKSLMDDKDIFLPNDVMRLQFEIITSIGIAWNRFEEKDIIYLPSSTKLINEVNTKECTNDLNKTTKNLKNDLFYLYEQKKFCDVTLQAGNDKFPVHKSILCARSPVFFAMFEREMTENKTGIVDILDLDADTVQHMIIFLYTDTVKELNLDMAAKLYFAADKYRIMPLREECSSFMKAHLDYKNVCHVLVLADRHRDDVLKLVCQQFIFSSVREIISSDEWKDFEKNNHELAIQTFRFLCLKKF